jgi:fatty-acid desaturase
MYFESNSRNVGILSVSIVILALSGLVNISMFTTSNLLISFFCFYLFNIIGVYLMLHRFYSHKTFKFKHNMLEMALLMVSMLAARGSAISWVYVHRHHHAYSDTINDPHCPKFLGFKLFGFGHIKFDKFNVFLIKDLMTPLHLTLHKYYMAIIVIFSILLAVGNYELFYFGWVLPVCLVHISQSIFNYFGHTHGYQNFKTKDDSRNNQWLFPLLMGEAWHNNHHANPKSMTSRVNDSEYDPLHWLIKLIKTESKD